MRLSRRHALVALPVAALTAVTLIGNGDASAAQLSMANVQADLAGLGFLQYSNVTGNADATTAAGVRAFQAAEGLDVDGSAGPATSDCLIKMTKAVQSKTGATADGLNGPGSQAALKKWQQAHGLEVDGRAGPGTHKAMGLPYEGVCKKADTPNPPPAPGNVRDKIRSEALYWNGKTPGQFRAAYQSYFGQPTIDSYCQDFVWYVWAHAGVKDNATYNKSHAVHSFIEYGDAHGTKIDGHNLSNAQVGDAVVSWNNGHHVAVVVAKNSDGTVDIMHGNWNGALHLQQHATDKDYDFIVRPA